MKTFKEFITEQSVHVNGGRDYGGEPNEKDMKYIEAGLKKFGGKYDGSSDKGAYFKFKDKASASNFVDYVKKAPNKTVFADLT